jgi:hypothetical protein
MSAAKQCYNTEQKENSVSQSNKNADENKGKGICYLFILSTSTWPL